MCHPQFGTIADRVPDIIIITTPGVRHALQSPAPPLQTRQSSNILGVGQLFMHAVSAQRTLSACYCCTKHTQSLFIGILATLPCMFMGVSHVGVRP